MGSEDGWKREEVAARVEQRLLQGRVDWESLRLAREDLSPLSIEELVKLLLEFLAHSKWRTRRAAAESLVELGNASVKATEQAFQDNHPDKQYWASWVLARLGQAGFPILQKAMHSDSRKMREIAVSSLGNCGIDEAVAPLVEALGDPEWTIRSRASSALLRYGDTTLEPLLLALESDNPDKCFWAARTLGGLLDKGKIENITPLIDLLKNATGISSRLLVYALGMSNSAEAIKTVAAYLDDPDRNVRIAACHSLEKAGLEAVEPLFEVLRGGNPEGRYWSAAALGRVLAFADQEIHDELLETVRNGNAQARIVAARALAAIRSEQGIRTLIEALSDSEPVVRRQIVESLQFVGMRAVPFLIEATSSPNTETVHLAARALGNLIGYLDEDQHEILGPLLKDERTLEAGLTALGAVGTGEAAATLRQFLSHPRWPVRERAAASLVTIGARSIPVLDEALKAKNGDEQFWATRAACWLLIRVGEPVLELVLRALRSGEKDLALEAIRTLGEFKHPRVIAALVESFGSPVWVVRAEASEALCRLGKEAMDSLSNVMKTTDNRDVHYWARKTVRRIKQSLPNSENW